MKSIVAAVATAAALGLSGAALADSAEGTIQKQNSWSFEIERGMMFTVNIGDMLKGLQPGDKVQVEYNTIEEERVVARVKKLDTNN